MLPSEATLFITARKKPNTTFFCSAAVFGLPIVTVPRRWGYTRLAASSLRPGLEEDTCLIAMLVLGSFLYASSFNLIAWCLILGQLLSRLLLKEWRVIYLEVSLKWALYYSPLTLILCSHTSKCNVHLWDVIVLPLLLNLKAKNVLALLEKVGNHFKFNSSYCYHSQDKFPLQVYTLKSEDELTWNWAECLSICRKVFEYGGQNAL